MKYLGKIENDYDIVNKKYVDNAITESGGVIVDSTLSSTSANPVQNKVVTNALNDKVAKESGKGLSSNDYTTVDKNKLASIAEGATNVVVDSTLSTTSNNPVANNVVTTELNTKITANSVVLNDFSSSGIVRNTTNCPTSAVVNLKYFNDLGLIYFRLQVPARDSVTFTSNTAYIMCTIPEKYRPAGVRALNVYNTGTSVIQSEVNSKGEITIRPKVANTAASATIYISGVWVI